MLRHRSVFLTTQVLTILALALFGAEPIIAQQNCSTPSFDVSSFLSGGIDPGECIAADFNNDGHQDILVANEWSSSIVSIFLNNGTGGLMLTSTVYPGYGWMKCAIGDLNKDGNIDLVVAVRGGHNLKVYEGNGDGSFTLNGDYSADPTSNLSDVAIGDFNNDTYLDLCTGSENDDIIVFLNTGTGSFGSPIRSVLGKLPAALTTGDLNGDGYSDLAAATYFDGTLSIMYGVGDGTFTGVSHHTVPDYPSNVFITDLNADSKPDIACTALGRIHFAVFLNDGYGAFSSSTQYGAGESSNWLAPYDYDGDGDIDLYSTVYEGNKITYWQNNGYGAMTRGNDVVFNNGTKRIAIISCDLNGDAYRDVVLSPASAKDVAVLPGTSTGGGLGSPVFYSVGGFERPLEIVAEDLNGDGLIDLASANYISHNISVYIAAGAGQYGLLPVVYPAGGNYPTDIISGHFNNDAYPDLAVVSRGSDQIGVLYGSINGTFSAPVLYGVGDGPQKIAKGDLNGDGRSDLVVTNFNATTISILIQASVGGFTSASALDVGSNPYGITIADYNNDGYHDVVVTTPNASVNNVRVLFGDGTGIYSIPNSHSVSQYGPFLVKYGDFNNDGKWDLLCVNSYGPSSVLLGNGNGTFQSPINTAVDGHQDVEIADFNNDGNADLASSASSVYVAMGDGTGHFSYPVLFDAGYSPHGLACADLDSDGRTDIAVVNHLPSNISILTNTMNQCITLTTGQIPSLLCAGSSVNVPFTVSGTLGGGNTFTAQLSNTSGSFAMPVDVGSLIGSTSGVISATIPSTILAGNGYRIRVVSSAPAIIGSDNGSAIDISATLPPVPSITVSPVTPVNPGGEPFTIYLGYGPQGVTLTANSSAVSYTWSDGVSTISTSASVEVFPTQTTTYTVTASNANGCVNQSSQTIAVIDTRCENGGVMVCHKCSGKTVLCLSPSAIQAHLNHGDMLGTSCPQSKDDAHEWNSGAHAIKLEQNHPNPFNPSTMIDFEVPRPCHVRLRVFSVLGRVVRVLVDGVRDTGRYSVDFDADALFGGTYFYQLEADGVILTRRMQFIK